jgi:3-phosphoshikimate 1-carboxyvinyltransferase
MKSYKVTPAKKFKGSPKIPGDKSVSHRSLIFGAMAEGKTQVFNLLESADVRSTARCLKQLGVKIEELENTTWVSGVGLKGFRESQDTLDCGNSGTTIRLMMGVLAGQKITSRLTGDSSLVKRPMKRVAAPLIQMGAKIELTNSDFAPMTITGHALKGTHYDLKVASAQIKTAITLAGLLAEGETVISAAIHSRDHTERLLHHFGPKLDVTNERVKVSGGQKLYGTKVMVPSDPSTAAFWIGAASIIPGAELHLENISLNPTRTGFLRVLQRMGAKIEVEVTESIPEPVGIINVKYGKLTGANVTAEEVPSLIDEIPLLAVIASQAHGVTQVEGAEELRVKESDRLKAIVQNLVSMGIEIDETNDGFMIEGPQRLKGATIESFHDHRIAMAFAIAGLVAAGNTLISNSDCVDISYPQFYSALEELTQ